MYLLLFRITVNLRCWSCYLQLHSDRHVDFLKSIRPSFWFLQLMLSRPTLRSAPGDERPLDSDPVLHHHAISDSIDFHAYFKKRIRQHPLGPSFNDFAFFWQRIDSHPLQSGWGLNLKMHCNGQTHTDPLMICKCSEYCRQKRQISIDSRSRSITIFQQSK